MWMKWRCLLNETKNAQTACQHNYPNMTLANQVMDDARTIFFSPIPNCSEFVTFFVKRLNCCPRTCEDHFRTIQICDLLVQCTLFVLKISSINRLLQGNSWVSSHLKLYEEKTNHFTNNFILLAFLLIAPSCYFFSITSYHLTADARAWHHRK